MSVYVPPASARLAFYLPGPDGNGHYAGRSVVVAALEDDPDLAYVVHLRGACFNEQRHLVHWRGRAVLIIESIHPYPTQSVMDRWERNEEVWEKWEWPMHRAFEAAAARAMRTAIALNTPGRPRERMRQELGL